MCFGSSSEERVVNCYTELSFYREVRAWCWTTPLWSEGKKEDFYRVVFIFPCAYHSPSAAGGEHDSSRLLWMHERGCGRGCPTLRGCPYLRTTFHMFPPSSDRELALCSKEIHAHNGDRRGKVIKTWKAFCKRVWKLLSYRKRDALCSLFFFSSSSLDIILHVLTFFFSAKQSHLQ